MALGLGCCCASESADAAPCDHIGPAGAVALDEGVGEDRGVGDFGEACSERASEPAAAVAVRSDRPVLFTVPVRRTDEGRELGLRLEPQGPRFRVTVVTEGSSTCAGRYNESALEEQKIRVGDFVVAADEQIDPLAIRQILERDEFVLSVERPLNFHVVVFKEGGPLGMGVNYSSGGMVLLVRSLDASGAAMDAGLQIGDRIEAVNGLRGPAKDLLEQLKISDSPQLAVLRFATKRVVRSMAD